MSIALSKIESSLAFNTISASLAGNDNEHQESSDPNAKRGRVHFTWEKTEPAGIQTFKLCWLLSQIGKLYQTSTGQLFELVSGMPPRHIRTHVDLEAFIRENLDVTLNSGGKPKGNAVPMSDLKVMMHSERFLMLIPVVDRIVSLPTYNSRWYLTKPGYNNGDAGDRFFMYGNALEPKRDPEYIRAFLDAMPFKSPGDKINTLAFALTVKLRHMWPGQKPFFPVTANKSHVGKDTIIDFASGLTRKEEISYHDKDWATQNEAVNVLINYDVGLLSIGNIRTKNIQSAFLERTVTSPKVLLQSSKRRGDPVHRESDFVVCASANNGRFSIDLANRAAPIHLELRGDIDKRNCAIGADPKHVFLPKHQWDIEAELQGLIENWKAQGMPLDLTVEYPMLDWAQVVGGILKANGFSGFLSNWSQQRSSVDSVRENLSILASVLPHNEWMRVAEIRDKAESEGLISQLMSPKYTKKTTSIDRQLGVILTNHQDETIYYEMEEKIHAIKILRDRRTIAGQLAVTYQFEDVETKEGEL